MNEKLWLHLAKLVVSKLPPQGDVGVQELKKVAEAGDFANLRLYLKNIAEQCVDPRSRIITTKTFGEDVTNIAQKLFPNVKIPS